MTDEELADLSFDAIDPADPFENYNNKPLWFPWRLDESNRKIPYHIDVKRKGWDNPNGRGDRDAAEAADARMPGEGGIGIVLGDPTRAAGGTLVGLDIDTSIDASGALAGWARGVVDAFATYTEVSPSGTGLKLYFLLHKDDLKAVRAAINKDKKGRAVHVLGKSWKRGTDKHPPSLELYTGGRWFAVTGNPRRGSPDHIAVVERDVVLDLINHYGPALAQGKTPGSPIGARRKSAKGRSEHAMAIGGRMRRNGAADEDIEAAILDDDIGASWAADHDQRQIDRVIERAGPTSLEGIEVDDIEVDDETAAQWELEYQQELEYQRRQIDPAIKRAKPSTKLTGYGLNEDGIAQVFAARFGGRLRFDHHIGKWYLYNGNYWRVQETRLAFDWVRRTCRALRIKNAQDPAARALAKKNTAEAVEIYAQRDEKAFAVTSEIWNRDPWLLGTPGGTVDLRTGELRPARQEDNITKIAAVAPVPFDEEMGCPHWRRFLNQVTRGDIELTRFLQQWCGYSLTGDIREEALIFIFGPGNNGKTKFLEILTWILGDYACTADMETFAAASFARHSTELAMLHGARVVGASETDEGRGWNESRIKALTGGDSITARFMRQDNFTFRPEFKLTLIGNNKPALRNLDTAARRRLNMVPFEFVPKTIDRELAFKLKREGPEILGWMIAGCLDWQQNGLVRPPVVLAATEAYFAEQDIIGRWLAECCDIGKSYTALSSELYASYCGFAQGEKPRSNMSLGLALAKRGFERDHTRDGARFSGLKLRDSDDL